MIVTYLKQADDDRILLKCMHSDRMKKSYQTGCTEPFLSQIEKVVKHLHIYPAENSLQMCSHCTGIVFQIRFLCSSILGEIQHSSSPSPMKCL